MRVVDPEDGETLRPDGESGELQLRGPMLFTRYYNNPDATASSLLPGGWFRSGDVGIIENGSLRLNGRLKDTIIVHGVSYSITELEMYLQTAEGVTHSFLSVSPYRAPNQDTEGFIVFYAPTFDLYNSDAADKLAATHAALRDISVKMITLPPSVIVPIPANEMEKTTLGKLSRARLLKQFNESGLDQHIAHTKKLLDGVRQATYVAPKGNTEIIITGIFALIFETEDAEISATDNFFELGGTSIDVIRYAAALVIPYMISTLTMQ